MSKRFAHQHASSQPFIPGGFPCLGYDWLSFWSNTTASPRKIEPALFLGAQARRNESPGRRPLNEERHNIAAAGPTGAAAAGAESALSEDPALAYLHAVVAVVVGSFLSSRGESLASETLAVGVCKHVSSP